jgi:hypothetical protein
MTNNPLKIAKNLKKEADRISEEYGIPLTLSQYGTPVATGSYALDLMAWQDIDIIVQLNDRLDSSSAIASLAYDFIQIPEAVVVRFERGLNQKRPELPQGDCLQLKLAAGEGELPWKYDIWFLGDEGIKANKKYMQSISDALTPQKRELILEMKQSIMLPSGRTPSLSGHYIYEAVLFEGMTEKKGILDYLSSKGVKLP